MAIASYIDCDRCSTMGPAARTRRQVVEEARAEGWRVGREHVCPDCVAGKPTPVEVKRASLARYNGGKP